MVFALDSTYADALHLLAHEAAGPSGPQAAMRQVARAIPVGMWASREEAVLTVALPGVEAEALDVSVVGRTLSVSGRRRPPARREEEVVLLRERDTAPFSGTVELPFLVQQANVRATYRDGQLTVHLPRAQEDRRHQIAVDGG